ncbi:MAG TPA: hypothetical protein VEC19_02175 [Usitatibacter sp.]|nr:hypothetical protein [Usitatibacter sp.]
MSARLAIATALAFTATACAAAAPERAPVRAKGEPLKESQVVALRNAGFEEPARPGENCAIHWACTMHADPSAFSFRLEAASPAQGRQSLCIERVKPEPWALVTHGLQDPALRGKRVRFSIALRVDAADGNGAGPFILVHGPQGNLAHDERLVKSTQGWQRMSVDFAVGTTARLVEVGATMQGGGRACIDDARVEILED